MGNLAVEPQQANLPFAVVEGTPYAELPEDLFIPPDALEVFLETFEGPLDLLLYLIRRQNLDILNIPIASITRQYIEYIEMMDELRMELAAEYLVMAAMLAEIKSRMLLPCPVDDDGDEGDPRAELIRRLQEYERFKDAGENIDALPRCERDTFLANAGIDQIEVKKLESHIELEEVLNAFRDVLKRVDQLSHHQILKEPLSVRERMSTILDRLQKISQLEFTQLFEQSEGKQGAVVSFLAILELSKDGLLEIFQQNPFDGIQIKAISE